MFFNWGRVKAMIYSCKDCVAPKRHPGCHGSCPEYLAEKAEYDRIKAISDKQRDIACAIIVSRGNKVEKALKNRKRS